MFFRSTLIAHKTARKPYFMGACSSASDNIKKIDISKAPSFRGFFNVKIRILEIARCFIEIQNSLILFGYMLKKILWLNKI